MSENSHALHTHGVVFRYLDQGAAYESSLHQIKATSCAIQHRGITGQLRGLLLTQGLNSDLHVTKQTNLEDKVDTLQHFFFIISIEAGKGLGCYHAAATRLPS